MADSGPHLHATLLSQGSNTPGWGLRRSCLLRLILKPQKGWSGQISVSSVPPLLLGLKVNIILVFNICATCPLILTPKFSLIPGCSASTLMTFWAG